MKFLNQNITKSFDNSTDYNQSLFETNNFRVIPSLGSLVDGWLLIIPKKHYISLGEINDDFLYDELNFLITSITSIIKKEYGEYVIFEHGPVESKTKVGCGVDYAHLHIVPIEINLINKSKEICNEEFIWKEVNNIHFTRYYYLQELPYLFYQTSFGKSFITTNENIPSQLFRKVIANHLNIGEKFDWKKYYFLNNIQTTIQRLSKYKLNNIQNKFSQA